jgi:hypothetical protein
MNVSNNPSVSDSDVNNSELLLHQRNVIVPATQRRNENNIKMTFADSALAVSILPQVRAARRRSNVVWAVITVFAVALGAWMVVPGKAAIIAPPSVSGLLPAGIPTTGAPDIQYEICPYSGDYIIYPLA